MNSVIDLTRVLYSGMMVYPGTPAPQFDLAHSIDDAGYAETSLQMYSHVGTHMDAPAHLQKGGQTLDTYPPSRFLGKGLVADLSHFAPGDRVSWSSLSDFERNNMKDVDFLLLDTGCGDDRITDEAYAVPSIQLLQRAVGCGIRTVGIDRMSVDTMGAKDLLLHRFLFDHDVLILENLKGLCALHGVVFSLCALPLLYKNADGAPTRVIAWRE